MLAFLLFLLGINVGSFLNVCIWRLPRGESVSHPPSHCPSCNTRLKALDLVPLLSQFLLRGHCRYCGAKFSWRYFGIELLTGVLFALVAVQPAMADVSLGSLSTADMLRIGRDLIFMATLVVIFWVDYDTKLIQLESVLILALAGIGYEFWQAWNGLAPLQEGFRVADELLIAFPIPLPGSLAALGMVGLVLWLVREVFSRYYQREAMGFGDVMLVAAIAANLGWNSTLVTFMFLSVVVGALLMILLQMPRAVRAFRWAKAREMRYGKSPAPPQALMRHAFRKGVPFGPMLAGGAVAALLYGVQLNAAYLNLWVDPTTPTTIQHMR
jgi:leader peptidase (prepilin peptidase)/N-methyltransferase